MVEERPDPEPGRGELLVRVRGAGLNGADMLQLRGGYPAPPGSPPDIPGLELAGEVVAWGPAPAASRAGDRVMAVVGGGAQAELAVVHERGAMPVPDGLDWPAAGGLPEVFTTAHDAVFTQAGCGPASACSCTAPPAGSARRRCSSAARPGARVDATVRRGSSQAVERARRPVIAPEAFGEHGPFDVVLELVGAGNLAENLAGAGHRRPHAVIGVGGRARWSRSTCRADGQRARILGSTCARGRWRRRRSRCGGSRTRCCRCSSDGASACRWPPPSRWMRSGAYERFQAGGKLGKLVVLP